VTVAIYLNKFSLAWLVLRGLGVEGGFGQTVALMTLLHLGVFLARARAAAALPRSPRGP